MAFALGAALAEPASKPSKMYRWVDEQGAVHYTDQIPPSQAERGHTELSDQGVPVTIVPAAQSIEEIQRERELERLRAQQERLVEQQNAADRVLLRTFRSVDDLQMARRGKIAAIDVVIGVARSNIRRQQEWLKKLRTTAANAERAGKPVPSQVLESIAKTERYIRDAYAGIAEREQEKNQVEEEFDRSLKRFRQLKDIPADATSAPKDGSRPALRNLVACGDAPQCDSYWQRAVAYVRANSSTSVQTVGPNILITAPPETREDVSLTLSRIQEKDSATASLFLDLQCKNQAPSDTSCKGEKAAKILDGFRGAVVEPQDAPGDANAAAVPEAATAPEAPGAGEAAPTRAAGKSGGAASPPGAGAATAGNPVAAGAAPGSPPGKSGGTDAAASEPERGGAR